METQTNPLLDRLAPTSLRCLDGCCECGEGPAGLWALQNAEGKTISLDGFCADCIEDDGIIGFHATRMQAEYDAEMV